MAAASTWQQRSPYHLWLCQQSLLCPALELWELCLTPLCLCRPLRSGAQGGMHSPPSASYTHLTKFGLYWDLGWGGVMVVWDGGMVGGGSGECSKTFHYNHPIRKTKTRVARNFGAVNGLIFCLGTINCSDFLHLSEIAIVEMLPHPNNGLFPLGVCSNWGKKDVSVCLCGSLQIGVVAAMTLAEFIMRVSLLLFLGKQACGWRDRHATNEQ